MTPRRALAAAVLAAGAAFASPAEAATRCVGEASLLYVCVATPSIGVGSTELCVYTGGSSCQVVAVPLPAPRGCPGVTWGGSVLPSGEPLPIAYECTTP